MTKDTTKKIKCACGKDVEVQSVETPDKDGYVSSGLTNWGRLNHICPGLEEQILSIPR